MTSIPQNGYLAGLKEYLATHDSLSVFDTALAADAPWNLHIHPDRIVTARLTAVTPYEVTFSRDDGESETVHKHDIHFLYPAERAAAVDKLVKKDKEVAALGLEPTVYHRNRRYVKNKTLFPLMEERTVVFVTLRDGSVVRGLITAFSRYDIEVSMKGGVAVTLLRHSLHDIQDKDGRCYLKTVQQERKDWKKSSLFVTL